ncbi:hypothetical protein SAMN04488020_101359 [Palleronia marisminoris]|uniref:Uncharacterized protein n=1 Tax=Palleronia marisminoris TaxID=315423 RepID=A0A1Y5RF46_9RHOB|nr:hypothetical protein [Palleronia marisminoris]SFG16174.1 hypothetical protein SAMN04488020_101359 [Palleronia marisminoris]SLN16022.1 hypothetical protein PAM7066_00359 [Palleronia marisminoris]
MTRALLLLPLLAACAAPVVADRPIAPREVTLYRDTVTAQMTDGALCTSVRGASSGPWSGAFRGCPHTWPVEVRRPTTRPRLPLAPVAQDPWVVLTAPNGAQGFGPRG